jgi:hypothetical protein
MHLNTHLAENFVFCGGPYDTELFTIPYVQLEENDRLEPDTDDEDRQLFQFFPNSALDYDTIDWYVFLCCTVPHYLFQDYDV